MAAPDDKLRRSSRETVPGPASSADPAFFRKRLARDSLALAAGSIAAGLLAYVFFAAATRSLGAHDAAPLSVLWSYWSIAAAILTFTVQHWIISTMTRDGHDATVARSLPWLAMATIILATLAGGLAFIFREPLFNDGGVFYPIVVSVITVESFFMGLVRGVQSGRRRFVATAQSLAAENGLRVAAAVAVAAADGSSKAFALALIAGPLTGLVWIRQLRLISDRAAGATVHNPLALASGVAGGSLIAQVVLTSMPVLLAVTGGLPAEVTTLFVALAVWRAPYIVLLGVAPQATTLMTRFAARGQRRRLTQVRLLVLAGIVTCAAVAVIVGLTVFEPVLQLGFGSEIEMDHHLLAALGAGTAVALGNMLLMLLLLALGRSGRATVAWTAALVATAGWLLIVDQPPLTQVVTGFVVAQLTAFALLFWWSWRLPATSAVAPSGSS